MTMERDFSRLRNAETRYRVLFQTSAEAVLVIDATSDKVVETNPAAARLFGDTVGRMIGRSFPSGLDSESMQALKTLAVAIRSGSNIEDVRVRLEGTQDEFVVSFTTFRQGASAFYLMRFTPAQIQAALPARSGANARRISFISKLPDGYVAVDQEGRILMANPAFLQMIQVMTEDQARGELIERWVGRSGVDVSVLIANLRQHKIVTMFSTLVRGEYGATASVEISAAALDDADPPSFGLSIRNVERRINQVPAAISQMPKSVDQLKELLGRVTLKDMVREFDRRDRATVHRSRAGTDRQQSRFGCRNPRAQPAEPLCETAPLRHGRCGRRRWPQLAGNRSPCRKQRQALCKRPGPCRLPARYWNC